MKVQLAWSKGLYGGTTCVEEVAWRKEFFSG